jgi:hypothetical protein
VPRIARVVASIALCVWPLTAAAETPDWDALADVETIEVITHDEDGEPRETKIWLAVLDGQGFIRTGGSSWGKNVKRDPDVVLRIEGTEYPLRVEFIEDEGLRERVSAEFREKYGWSDALISQIRGSNPDIMHMIARY